MDTIKAQKVQVKPRVAFLGPECTFSHIAVEKNFKHFGVNEIELVSCDHMEDVVKAVVEGKAEYGLAPYWNTCKHRIVTAQIGLIGAPSVGIVDNFKMDINLFLVSKAKSISDVSKIHTIKHVIKQFSVYHSEKLKGILNDEVESTVRGIEMVLTEPTAAAVCSPWAAKKYDRELNILGKDIQNQDNATLFFVLKKEPKYVREDSEYYTLIAYPLEKQFKTRIEITDLVMEKLVMLTNEWNINQNEQKKWGFIEVFGHVDDAMIREFVDEMKEKLPATRALGCYKTRITEIWDGESRFNSY